MRASQTNTFEQFEWITIFHQVLFKKTGIYSTKEVLLTIGDANPLPGSLNLRKKLNFLPTNILMPVANCGYFFFENIHFLRTSERC